MKTKKLFIIILNYNGGQKIINCLNSLQAIKKPKAWQIKTLIIDNNSTDNSIELIKVKFPNLKILRNKKNLGFAAGNNQGISYALKNKPEAILLLNQDTQVTQNFLLSLLKNKADLISPVIKFKRRGKWVYDFGGQINWWLGQVKHLEMSKALKQKTESSRLKNKINKIDFISGCCLLIRSDVFKKIGLLDERFFLYYEDIVFCLKAKKAGFSLAVEPKSIIFHQLIEPQQRSFKQNLQLLKSHFLFISQNIPWQQKPTAYLFWLLLSFKIITKH